MTNYFLQQANLLLAEKLRPLSSKSVYDQLSQFFRINNDDEDDIFQESDKTLPCRYSNAETFRNQTRRITQIESEKLTRKKKTSHPEIRLSVDSLLAVQLFSILKIDINEFLNTLAYRLDCEQPKTVSADSNEEDDEECGQVKKERKKSRSLEELYNALVSSCANINVRIEAINEISDFANLSNAEKNAINVFIEQFLREIRNLEQFSETSALEKSQIKSMHPKVVRNVAKLEKQNEEKDCTNILDLFKFEEENSSERINFLKIRPQLYIYCSFLIICIMRDFLKRVKATQKTGERQLKSMMRVYFLANYAEMESSTVAKIMNEKTGTSKAGIKVFENNALDEFSNIFSQIKLSFDDLLSYFSRTTSTSYDDVKEEIKLRNFLTNLTKQIFEIFENPTLNFRRQKITQYNSIQEILRTKKFFDYTFVISKERLENLKSLAEQAKDTCEEIKKDILKYETFKEPELSDLQKDARDFIFNSWKKVSPIIALDMGTGKTRVACATIRRFIKENKDETGYILVVIPAGLKSDWQEELEKNNILNSVYLVNNDRKNYFKNNKIQATPLQVFVTSYDIAAYDYEMYKNNPPCMIIYDELQLINTANILDKCLVLSKLNMTAKYKFALSGTPMQNDTKEFFVNYCFLHDNELLIKAHNENSIKTLSWENEPLKKVKEELKAKRFYFFGREDTNLKIDEKFIPIVFKGKHLEKFIDYADKDNHLKMQYLLNPKDFGYQFDSAKISFVKQFIKELPPEERVIIFSYYKKPLRYLYNELKKYNPAIATGNDINDEDEDSDWNNKNARTEIEKFKSSKNKSRVLLGTIKLIGTGENLQVANNIIILDLWWNPMVIIQAMYRIKRKDQTKPVHIYFPIYTNTKGVAISMEKNYLQTMMRKIKLYNDFLHDIGYTTVSRTLPEKTLKEPLIFDQKGQFNGKKTLMEKLCSEEDSMRDVLFGRKKIIIRKEKDTAQESLAKPMFQIKK